MRTQEIIFAVSGQSFYYDPAELALPSSVTVQVFSTSVDDSGTAESATTGSASVGSVDTTLSVAADAGDSSITVTDATGIKRGRRYLLMKESATGGPCEWAEVLSIVDEVIGLRRPLVNSYTTGSTFQDTRISIAVNSTWVNTASKITDPLGSDWRTDRDNSDVVPAQPGYRIRWAYTINGSATVAATYADLVRYPARNLVTPIDVDTRFPGWIDRLGPDYREDQGASLIEDAFDAVRMDALGDAKVVRRIRDTDVLRELVMCRSQLLQLENQVMSGNASLTALEAAQAVYKQRYNQLIREPKFADDPTGGGAAAQAERLPVWRR